MVTYAIPNFTNGSQGIESIIGAEAVQVPILVPSILFFIFVIIMGVGFFSQQRRTGAGNLPMWGSIAGLITTTGSFILYLYDNIALQNSVIINIQTITISLAVTIMFALVFVLSDRSY